MLQYDYSGYSRVGPIPPMDTHGWRKYGLEIRGELSYLKMGAFDLSLFFTIQCKNKSEIKDGDNGTINNINCNVVIDVISK